MSNLKIEQKYTDNLLNIALDTLENKKQALVFVNTKRSAEKSAEDISKKLKTNSKELTELAEKILKVVSKPTKQCKRLAKIIEKGIAFHHAGLHAKQRELIEDAFRDKKIKIICATPTLAAGIDVPAFRSIIRDVKRFTSRGMQNIPVLEYLQMAGRCGRPSFDSYGEAILIASTETEKRVLTDKYIYGEPEDIYSKLAVEPVLRTYLLSLISTKVIQTTKEILDFFEKTFWAYQFENMDKLELIITKMLDLLTKWGFIQVLDDKYRATLLGKRITELYIDPLTAHHFIKCLKRTEKTTLKPFSFLQIICNTLEMRPLLRVRMKEYDEIQDFAANYEPYLLDTEPSMFEPEYETYLDSIKTANMIHEWIEEKDEEYLLEKFNTRPGELHMKKNTADWLLYALYEIARIQEKQPILKEITKTRLRLKYGAKEELLNLLRLENIGRIRARKLFYNKIKDLRDIKKAKQEDLIKILGKSITLKVLIQAGVSLNEKNTDKGQLNNFL